MCVCVCERESERERETDIYGRYSSDCDEAIRGKVCPGSKLQIRRRLIEQFPTDKGYGGLKCVVDLACATCDCEAYSSDCVEAIRGKVRPCGPSFSVSQTLSGPSVSLSRTQTLDPVSLFLTLSLDPFSLSHTLSLWIRRQGLSLIDSSCI